MKKIVENIAKLIDTKSLMTLSMMTGMLFLLSGAWHPADGIIALFSATFGSITTYFFTKPKDNGGAE